MRASRVGRNTPPSKEGGYSNGNRGYSNRDYSNGATEVFGA